MQGVFQGSWQSVLLIHYPPVGSSLISKGNIFHIHYKQKPTLKPTILLEKCTLCWFGIYEYYFTSNLKSWKENLRLYLKANSSLWLLVQSFSPPLCNPCKARDLFEGNTDVELKHPCVPRSSSPLQFAWLEKVWLSLADIGEDQLCSLCPQSAFQSWVNSFWGVMYCESLLNHRHYFCVSLWFLSARMAKSFSHYLPLMSDLLDVAHWDLNVFQMSQVELLRACSGGMTLLPWKSITVSQLTSLERELKPKLGAFENHTLHI